MSTPPHTKQTHDNLPDDPRDRREALQDVFGDHLFALRCQVLSQIDAYVKSRSRRNALGNLRRRVYDCVAEMPEAEQRKALALADRAIQVYMQYAMAVLDDEGVHMKIGPSHFVHYRLTMELRRLPDAEIIEEHVINRSPLPTLGEKFGRWLNRFGVDSWPSHGECGES